MDDWLLPTTQSRGSTTSPSQTPPTSSTSSPDNSSSSPTTTTSPSTPTIPPTGSQVSNDTYSPSSPAPLSTDASPASQTSPTVILELVISPQSPGLLELLGRGQRIKKPSVLLKKFVTNAASTTDPSHVSSPLDQSSSNAVSGKTLYPIDDYISVSAFSAKHQAFLASITTEEVPRTYKEAVLDERFNGAMKTEITALEDNHTWDVTTLPPGKKVIGCGWRYSNKYPKLDLWHMETVKEQGVTTRILLLRWQR